MEIEQTIAQILVSRMAGASVSGHQRLIPERGNLSLAWNNHYTMNIYKKTILNPSYLPNEADVIL